MAKGLFAMQAASVVGLVLLISFLAEWYKERIQDFWIHQVVPTLKWYYAQIVYAGDLQKIAERTTWSKKEIRTTFLTMQGDPVSEAVTSMLRSSVERKHE